MKIQVLGPGCANCEKLEQNVRTALLSLGDSIGEAEIEKITDSDTFAEMGLLVTPGLAIDGELKASGRVLSSTEIEQIIQSA